MCWSLLYLSWSSISCQLFARCPSWPPKSGLYPPRRDLKHPHWITPWTLCAVHREADILSQMWICARECCLCWLMIFPALRPAKVWYPTRKASNLSGQAYLHNALPEPQQSMHFLKAHGQGYVQTTCSSCYGIPALFPIQSKFWPS